MMYRCPKCNTNFPDSEANGHRCHKAGEMQLDFWQHTPPVPNSEQLLKESIANLEKALRALKGLVRK